MLTADLVRAQRRNGVLRLTLLNAQSRERAGVIAKSIHQIVLAHKGRSRAELEDALNGIDASLREQKLQEGLKKLILDHCHFEVASSLDPAALRQEVFLRANERRRQCNELRFDRMQVIDEVAQSLNVTKAQVEEGLYADLGPAHRLHTIDALSTDALIERFDLYQASAVMLRAQWLNVELCEISPQALRRLMHQVKFRQLLYSVERTGQGYRVHIDGPMSLFSASTKYGLQLALLLPHLELAKRWELRAQLRWGQKRQPLAFQLSSAELKLNAAKNTRAELPEIQEIIEAFQNQEGPWEVRTATEIFEMGDQSCLVPDLEFLHRPSRKKVYFELLGYWSREAVWKRIDLIEKGMPHPVMLALSEKLRVSEQALPPKAPGALFVFKNKISIKSLKDKLESCLAK